MAGLLKRSVLMLVLLVLLKPCVLLNPVSDTQLRIDGALDFNFEFGDRLLRLPDLLIGRCLFLPLTFMLQISTLMTHE